jgi:hypothetical protein
LNGEKSPSIKSSVEAPLKLTGAVVSLLPLPTKNPPKKMKEIRINEITAKEIFLRIFFM